MLFATASARGPGEKDDEQPQDERGHRQAARRVPRRRAVAQVAVAKAHENFLVLPHGVAAPFLAVRRSPLQARPLRGRVELLFLGVRVARLHDLAAPSGRARHRLHADARLRGQVRQVGVLEAVLAAAQVAAGTAAEAAFDDRVRPVDQRRRREQQHQHHHRRRLVRHGRGITVRRLFFFFFSVRE